jgi:hypothetical protein
MIVFGKKVRILALLLGAALFGSGPPARAGYVEIDYSIDGGPRQVAASSTTGVATWTDNSVGGLFSVIMSFGTSNSPGGTTALVTQSNNYVNTLYTSGSHTLSVYVSSTGFNLPGGNNLNLGNASSITENSGSTQVTFTSFADTGNNGNNLFGMSGSTVTSTSTSYSVTGQQGNGNQSTTTFSGTAYSLTNEGDYKMTGGTSLTVVSGSTTVTPTPAPPGLFMALTGLPCLAAGGWLRFRRK